MRKGDAQIGLPAPVYNDTKANVEALTGVVEGATAYATDTDEPGWYDGAAWVWGAGGAGGGNETFTDTFANEPAPSNAGDLFLPSDGFHIERDTGAAWVPWGPIFPMEKPISGDFAWLNQGTATYTDSGGSIYLYVPAVASSNMRALIKAAPAAPYTITAAINAQQYIQNYNNVGIVWRESGTGKLVSFTLGNPGYLLINKWNSATSFNATYTSSGIMFSYPIIFLRIADDNTNRICSWSIDGQNFLVFHSVGRTDFITADEVGFYGESANETYPVAIHLASWKEE